MDVSKSNGFTLIELLTVIVILGTLSISAAPVLLDLTEEAHASETISTMSAFKTGLHLLHVKHITSGSDPLVINNIEIRFTEDGWPVGTSRNSQGCAELWEAIIENGEEIYLAQNFSVRLQPGWNTYAHQDLCAYINTQDNVPVAENDAPHFVYYTDQMTFPGRGLNYDGKAGDVIAYNLN